MANIKKTFNFRNGVQVDDDNLIVNQTGLVGIGTTVPTEALDVRGKVKVLVDPNVAGSGEINATTGIITSLTVTNLTVSGNDYSGGVIGVGISVGTAGIITATEPSGIVTYYGDGKELLNLPTSQWIDKDVGLGYTSIYAQGGVGVGTVDPRFTFQVSGNNDLTNFEEGVGINDKGGAAERLRLDRTGRVTQSVPRDGVPTTRAQPLAQVPLRQGRGVSDLLAGDRDLGADGLGRHEENVRHEGRRRRGAELPGLRRDVRGRRRALVHLRPRGVAAGLRRGARSGRERQLRGRRLLQRREVRLPAAARAVRVGSGRAAGALARA